MKINWRNRIENAILILVAVVVTFQVAKGIYQPVIETQNETIVELTKIARFAITNQFDKIKAKKGEIILDLNSTINSQELEVINSDSIPPKNRNLWQWIFNKKSH